MYEVKDKKLYITTPKGQEFVTTLGNMLPNNIERIGNIWDMIGDQYRIIDKPGHKLIYLEPTLYWTIYKKCPYGKEMIKRTVPYFSENIQYHFCQPAFYFEDHDFDEDYGVYGLYTKEDELVYVGYTKSGFESRWKKHLDNLDNPNGQFLYQTFKIDELEMRPIVSAHELKEKYKIHSISSHMLELMEYAVIAATQPRGNTEGVKTPYTFRSNNKLMNKDLSDDYWTILRIVLLEGDYWAKEYFKDLMPTEEI